MVIDKKAGNIVQKKEGKKTSINTITCCTLNICNFKVATL